MGSSIRRREFDLRVGSHTLRICTLQHATPPPAIDSTLVFLHDSLGCIELWKDFPQKLALYTGLNGLIYDRPGHGSSSPIQPPAHFQRQPTFHQQEVQYLEMIAQKCALSRLLLFGHSDGGTIALLAAALSPELVSGVITEGAHVFVDSLTLRGVRRAKLDYQNTDLRSRLQRYHGNKTDTLFNLWTETWLSKNFRSWSIESFLPQIHSPVLAIQGEMDEFKTPRQLKSITQHISGEGIHKIIENTGHTPHRENPSETLRVTGDFILNLLNNPLH